MTGYKQYLWNRHLSPEVVGLRYVNKIPSDQYGNPARDQYGKYIMYKYVLAKSGIKIPEALYKFSYGAYIGGDNSMYCNEYHLTELETCRDVTIECALIYVPETFNLASSNCDFLGVVIKVGCNNANGICFE